MRGATHALGGLAAGLAVATLVGSVAQAPLIIMVAVLASLLPDIDHPRSTISRNLGVPKVTYRFVRHRGVVHSIEAALLMGVALATPAAYILAAPGVIPGFLAGYVSHLALDSLTPTGVRWSVFRKRKARGPIRTGSAGETILFVLLMFLDAYMLYRTAIFINLG